MASLTTITQTIHVNESEIDSKIGEFSNLAQTELHEMAKQQPQTADPGPDPSPDPPPGAPDRGRPFRDRGRPVTDGGSMPDIGTAVSTPRRITDLNMVTIKVVQRICNEMSYLWHTGNVKQFLKTIDQTEHVARCFL